MERLRSVRLISAVMFLLFLFGCGETQRNERLTYKKPDTAVKSNVLLGGNNVGGRTISELTEMLGKYATDTYEPPADASVNRQSWDITAEKSGKRLNIGKTIDALKNAREGGRVDYVFDAVKPSVTTADLKKKIKVISSYSTVLLDRSDNRVNNIFVASQKINNTILNPGEEFSFNGVVGKRTAAKGYEEAPIIKRTPEGPKKKKAKGGGVCQISTTIYNAVEECGLKVTERHIHSLDVGYVPRGDDATVSYGTVDFRFVNSRGNPIMLKLYLNGNSLKVTILENTIKPATSLYSHAGI